MTFSSLVSFNGKFVAQPVTGVQRFAAEMLSAMDRLLASGAWTASAELELLVPAGHAHAAPALRHICVRELPAASLHVWEQLRLPVATRGRLLINLAGSAPLFKRHQICTFHDAAIFDIPEAYSGSFGRWYRFLFRAQGHACQRVLTVSEFSRRRLSERLSLPEARIGIVPNGASHVQRFPGDDSVLRRLGVSSDGYLLAVGSDNPSKNFPALIRAFEGLTDRPQARLVVVGGGNTAVFAASAGSGSIDPRIVRAGRVDDAQLKSLYTNARAFVFPSLYEGFGIPPLEAMACGCPVLAARAASIPEVCGDAAGYFDPSSVEQIGAAMLRALDDVAWLADLREAGTRRVKHFSWESAAIHLLRELSDLGVVRAQIP